MRYNPTIKNQTAMKETSTPRFQPERHGRRLRAMRGNPAGGKNTLEPVRQHEGYAEAAQDHGQRRGIRAARKGHDDMVRRYAARLFQKTPDRHAQPSPGGR